MSRPSSSYKNRKIFRRRGEISLACHLMREGLLDVCLVCGQVYTHFKGKKRKRKLRRHYKGYMWVKLYIEDIRKNRRKRNKQGRKRWGMSAFVHRLSIMKKLAIRNYRIARFRGEVDSTKPNWKSFVLDLPPTIDIDHKDLKRDNNAGKNLRVRTHNGNSQHKKYTKQEQSEIDKEFEEFYNS